MISWIISLCSVPSQISGNGFLRQLSILTYREVKHFRDSSISWRHFNWLSITGDFFYYTLATQQHILFTFLLPSLVQFLISLSERWWDTTKLIERVWYTPRTLPRWPLYQRNNKTGKTKGSEEDFPWHSDVRDRVAVAEFIASFQRNYSAVDAGPKRAQWA